MSLTWTELSLALGGALLGALLVVVVVELLARLAVRRWEPGQRLVHAARLPFRVLVLVLALNGVVAGVRGERQELWWQATTHTARVLAIVAVAWLVGVVLLFLGDLALRGARTDVPDNRVARRRRTQVLVLRRLTVAVVVLVTLGAVMLTFPGVRAVGASVLASAGLISVVAALAAQSMLANVFAGMQLAFSDAIRLDDAVIVEEEWGWIEEITLSYVVVRLWDDRRMVLPCTYFTTTPFQNWTRHSSELLGVVELDLDFGVDTDAMRLELERLLPLTDLWDGRTQVLQVTDAVGGFARVRVLVSAADASLLFDLRCHVREELVRWLRTDDPAGLPRQRLTVDRGDDLADDHP